MTQNEQDARISRCLRFKSQPALTPGASHQIMAICSLIFRTQPLYSLSSSVSPSKIISDGVCAYFKWSTFTFPFSNSATELYVPLGTLILLSWPWSQICYLLLSLDYIASLPLLLSGTPPMSPILKASSNTASLSSLAEGGKGWLLYP